MVEFWAKMVKAGKSIDTVPAKWRELVIEFLNNDDAE